MRRGDPSRRLVTVREQGPHRRLAGRVPVRFAQADSVAGQDFDHPGRPHLARFCSGLT